MSNISFLHQTTTGRVITFLEFKLSNISFLHQTTTLQTSSFTASSCQISLFYIKPQQKHFHLFCNSVVKYLFSTSNHNKHKSHHRTKLVVKYLFSTSNHNKLLVLQKHLKLSNISFLHQTTTPSSQMV